MEDNEKLKALHESLIKDNYELPSYDVFAEDLRNPEKSKAFYDGLVKDNYELPEYEVFVNDLGLKKKVSPADYGLPSKEVFAEMFGNLSKPEVSERPPDEYDADKFATPDTTLISPELSGPKLNSSIGTFPTYRRGADLSLQSPEFKGPKLETVGETVSAYLSGERITDKEYKSEVEKKISELDKEIAALPKDDTEYLPAMNFSGGLILPSRPVSEEKDRLLKQKDELRMAIETPSKLTYILGKAYNQSLIGLADNILNGTPRANQEWLSKYDAGTLTDATATALGFMLDMPFFGGMGKVGAEVGKLAAKPIVDRVMTNSVKKLTTAGIEEKLAKELAIKGATKVSQSIAGMTSSGTALGSYGVVGSALGDWAKPDAHFDDIKWGNALKRGAKDFVLGVSTGGLGIGSSVIASKASAIPNIAGRIGAKAGTSIGGLTAESALFTYGGALLDGRAPKDVSKEEFIDTMALLGILKVSNKAGKVQEAITDPKKAVTNIYKSLQYDPKKPGEGQFSVDINQWEIEAMGGKDYKSVMDIASKDNKVLADILKSDKVPALLKQKLLWGSRGVAIDNVNFYGDKVVPDGEFVDIYNKEGVLLDKRKYSSKQEADQAILDIGLQLEDNKMQMRSAMSDVDKVKIISELKAKGTDIEKLLIALDKPVKDRSIEESKMVADYASMIPKEKKTEGETTTEEKPEVKPEEPKPEEKPEPESKLAVGEKQFKTKDELNTYLESVAIDKKTGEVDERWFDREVNSWPSPETVKAINEWTENKKAEIKAKKPQPKEEPIETGVTKVEQKELTKNDLIDEVRRFNILSASGKKKAALQANTIRVNAQRLGYELKEGMDEWKIGITKDGKFLALRKDPVKTDKTKIESQKLLTEYDKDFQDYVSDVFETNPDLFGVMIGGLTNEQRAQAFRDIKAGKKTTASSQALNELERMYKESGGIDIWNAEGQMRVRISRDDIRAEIEDLKRRKRDELFSTYDLDVALEKGLLTKTEYDEIRESERKQDIESRAAEEDFYRSETGDVEGSKEKGTEGTVTPEINEQPVKQPDITTGKEGENNLPAGTEKDVTAVEATGKTEPSGSLGSATRFRPSERVDFQTPLTGPSGAKLVSYEWTWKPEEKFDKREGELKAGRVSDWDRALSSAETGRDVVHQFLVEMPDGSTKLMSAESALNVLGFTEKNQSKNMPSLVSASKTLAKNQMELSIKEAQNKAYNDAKKKLQESAKPEITREVVTSDKTGQDRAVRRNMGEGSVLEHRMRDTDKLPEKPSGERMDALVDSWMRRELEKQGLKSPYGLGELRTRVERQKKKINEILSQAKVEGQGTKEPVSEPAKVETPEKKVEIPQGIKFKDKNYTDIEQVQDDLAEGKITFEESKTLMEDVRKFEDNLKIQAETQAQKAGEKMNLVSEEAEQRMLDELNPDKGKLYFKFLPPIIERGSTSLWKQLIHPRDALANWMAGKIGEGLKNQNDLLRWHTKALTNLYNGLARTQADIHGRKKGDVGKLAMTGTVKVYAPHEGLELYGKLKELVHGDYESLARVWSIIDPEMASLKEGEKPLTYGDLTLAEKNLYNTAREWIDWGHETNYAAEFLPTETYLKNKDATGRSTYIARMYDTHEVDATVEGLAKNGKGSVSIRLITDYMKARKEVDDWKKEHAIKDPAYLVAKRVMQTIQNVAIGRYQDLIIREHPDYVISVKKGQDVPKGYTKLGGSYAWGKFRNKAVIDHVVEDFTGYYFANNRINMMYDLIKSVDQSTVNQFYKKYRTVFNPFVQTGNIAGNLFLASINGMNPVSFAAKQIKYRNFHETHPQIFKSLLKSGLIGEFGITGDIRPLIQGDVTKKDDPSGLKGLYKKFEEKTTNLYVGADNVAKIAAYMTYREHGLSHELAVRRAYDAFQNYATVGKTWDFTSKIPVIGPTFVKFQADLQRILLNNMLTTPLTTIGTVALIKLFGDLTSRMSGETDEEKEIREGRKGIPKIPIVNIPLSFRMGDTEVNFAKYLTPFYLYPQGDSEMDIYDFSKFAPLQLQKPKGGSKIPLPAFADATWGWFGSILADRDFRNFSIQDPIKTAYKDVNISKWERFANVMHYFARSQVPFYKGAEDMVKGMTGQLDYYGRKREWWQAITNNIIKTQQFGDTELKSYMERQIDYLTQRFAALSENMGDANNQFLKAMKKAEDMGMDEDALQRLYEKEDKLRSERMQKSLDEQVPVMQELERITKVYKGWDPNSPFIQENFLDIEAGKSRRFNVMNDVDLQKQYPYEYKLLKKNDLLKTPRDVPRYLNGEKLTDDQRKKYVNTYWQEYIQFLDYQVGLTEEEFQKMKESIVDKQMSSNKPVPEDISMLQKISENAYTYATGRATQDLIISMQVKK